VTLRARIALPREPEWICKGMEELSDADFVGVDTLVHLAVHPPIPFMTCLQIVCFGSFVCFLYVRAGTPRWRAKVCGCRLMF